MGEMRLGYGSEFHLLRMLGRHRSWFTKQVRSAVGIDDEIEWLDFSAGKDKDEELRGISFFNNESYNQEWKKIWPQTGNPMNWDCVGITKQGKMPVFIEAKAHRGELKSDTGASKESLAMIQKCFTETRKEFKIQTANDWAKGYYQKANRIAVLWFFKYKLKKDARLVTVYFCDDLGNSTRDCPRDKSGWETAISDEEKYLGIERNLELKPLLHKCFIDIHLKKAYH